MWRGASGATSCRIADISLSGCFVESLSAPPAGEEVIVSIRFKEAISLSLRGRVVYVDPGIGFGVQFLELPEADARQLKRLIDLLVANPRQA
jgi:hypothetical protein